LGGGCCDAHPTQKSTATRVSCGPDNLAMKSSLGRKRVVHYPQKGCASCRCPHLTLPNRPNFTQYHVGSAALDGALQHRAVFGSSFLHPRLQRAINRRAASRIRVMRGERQDDRRFRARVDASQSATLLCRARRSHRVHPPAGTNLISVNRACPF
jgi:hypothetical protein